MTVQLEQWTYRQFARIYPHECYDLDPERFWAYFRGERPGVSREIMEAELREMWETKHPKGNRKPVTDPRKISEKVFQAEVIKAARIQGWLIAHFRPAMTKDGWRTPVEGDGAGFPDCVLIRSNRLIFAELKSDKGKVFPQQRLWLDALKAGQWIGHRNGGEYVNYETYVWRPSDIDKIWEILSK